MSVDYDQDVVSLETLDSLYGSDLIFDDPSINGPNLKLGTGSGLNFSGYSDMDGGEDSDWSELQWEAPTYFTSGNMSTTAKTDSTFGTALGSWAFGNSNDYTSYAVYGTKGSYVYQLQTEGGSLNDVLLQSKSVQPKVYTFNHQITFTANESLSNVQAGSGVYQVGNNFIVSFNYNGQRADFFLQSKLADSRANLSSYSTIPRGITTSNIGAMSGTIYDVVNKSDSTGSVIPYDSVAYLPFSNQYSTLHTVTVNVNAELLQMIRHIESINTDASLDAALNDMSNWSLTTVYVGTESGDGTATSSVNVQNLEVHYDTSKTIATADDEAAQNASLVTITGVPYQVRWNNYATVADSSMNLEMQPYYSYDNLTAVETAQNLTLNGNWDTVDLNATGVIANVVGGASFNGDNGYLTVSGSGAYYAAGTYTSLTATLDGRSSINAVIDTASTITNSGGNVALNGDNASLVYTGSGDLSLVGTFTTASITGVTGGTSWVLMSGNTTIENDGAAMHVTADADFAITANSGDTEVTGNSSGTLTLNGGDGTLNMYGSWSSITGTVGTNQMINLQATKANVTDDGGTVNLTGTGNGALTFSGTGSANIVGDWSAATVSLSSGQYFNAKVDDNLNISIGAGANAAVWSPNGNSVSVKQDGGTSVVAMGTGYDSLTMNMASTGTMTVNNFSPSHGILMLTNLQNNNVSIAYQNGNTVLTDGTLGGKVVLNGVSHVSLVSSVGSTNFSDQTGSLTMAVLT